MRHVLALLLGLEAVNAALWAGRIVSVAAAYDLIVLGMVTLRVGVTALQMASAWMLVTRALPAVAFARASFAVSAVLLVLEIGFRLAPSRVPPGFRMPIVVGYALYAFVCIAILAIVNRADRELPPHAHSD